MATRMRLYANAKTAEPEQPTGLTTGLLPGEVPLRSERPRFPQAGAARLAFRGMPSIPISHTPIQRKATVSVPSDPLEKAADEGAEKLLRMEEPAFENGASGTIQRKCASCEDEDDKCKAELPIQRRGTQVGPSSVTPIPQSVRQILNEPGRPMATSTRVAMETRFGRQLGNVRVHTGSNAAQSARDVHALAFTVGQHIVFGQDRYAPETSSGQNLLVHELAHTLQQRDGRLSEGTRRLEAEADRFAAGAEGEWRQPVSSLATASAPTLQRSPTQCSSVTIRLPNSIVFEGDEGSLSAPMTPLASLHPGSYTMSYDRGNDRFVIAPMSSTDDVISVELANRPVSEIAKYRGYRESLAERAVPLRVLAGDASVASGDHQTSDQLETQFNVRIMTPTEFHTMTGLSADTLTEGMLVNGSQLPIYNGNSLATAVQNEPVEDDDRSRVPQAFGLPAAMAKYPSYPIPTNSAGILWTQSGIGHLSQLVDVNGALTVRGYRFPLVLGAFKSLLSKGVPGGYKDDFLFTILPKQTVVHRQVSPQEAAKLAEQLREPKYENTTYRLPPRAGSKSTACGTNCITVPVAEIEATLGGRPEILTPEGPVDITQMGQPTKGGPFERQQAGRGVTVRAYLDEQPDAVFEERGLTKLKVPTEAIAARQAVFLLRVGGKVLLIYGIGKTVKRIYKAWDSPQLPHVIADETASWSGGLLGGALGSALGAGIACSPTGPVTLVCVAGGFLGGLLFGAIGATMGGAIIQGDDGSVCPSCHAQQREWTRRGQWTNFRDPMFELKREGIQKGASGTSLDTNQLRILRAFIEAGR